MSCFDTYLYTMRINLVCLFSFFFHPTWEFFIHMEKSSFPVFWHLLGNFSVIEQWRSTTTVTRGIRWKCSSPMTCDTYTYLRVFGSGAVTTCFYDMGLSLLGFEHPTFARGANAQTDCATAAVQDIESKMGCGNSARDKMLPPIMKWTGTLLFK